MNGNFFSYLTEVLKFLNNNSGALIAISSFVLAVTTFIYVILTSRLVLENKKTREVLNAPKVFAVIEPFPERASLVEIVIKNIGFGPAFNIIIKVEPDFMCYSGKKLLSEHSFVKRGISYLVPGDEFRHFLNEASDMKKEEIETIYKGSLTYRDVYGKVYSSNFVIDFSARDDVRFIKRENKIVKNLEKISEDFHNFATRFYLK